MATLLEKTRQVNELLQKNNLFDVQAELPYNKMAMILGDILESNAYIISSSGDLLGYTEKLDVNNARIKNMFKEKKFPQGYTEAVDMLKVTEANISIDSDLTAFPFESRELYPFGLTTIVPLYGAGKRLGTIILARVEKSFNEDDLVLAEYSATVVGMQILYHQSRTIEADVRSATAVQMAINTLSYSELKAVHASSIADEIGITRSVIVNALRKLESAGIIESRSLGMKGTYLKVLNQQFIKELEK